MRQAILHECFWLFSVALLPMVVPPAGAETTDVWEGPALKADPQTVLEALANTPAPEGAHVEVLLQETVIEVDEHSRIHRVSTEIGRGNAGTIPQSSAPLDLES